MYVTSHMNPADHEHDLLEAARAGDERAFGLLVEPHRGRLHSHCYRMLGSAHDADDGTQETLVRAWRGLPGFDGRSALGSWLHRIATNTCLNLIKRHRGRVLPIDYCSSSADPHDGPVAPDARYEQRESLELAFVAALQHLPPSQRAALILTEGLGFSAREVAGTLETTTASVNSALQRARKVLRERLPDRSQQATLRAIGDPDLNAVVEQYMHAMEEDDVGAIVDLSHELASHPG